MEVTIREIEIREDISLEDIYKRARQEKNGRVRARLLGIAAVLEGEARAKGARIAGLTINNFRSWIARFNEKGFEGVLSKKPPGRSSKLTDAAKASLRAKILRGPNYKKEGIVSYRLVDIQDYLQKNFGICYGLSGVWYMLKELELSWLCPRPQHPQSDARKIASFKKGASNKAQRYPNTTPQQKA